MKKVIDLKSAFDEVSVNGLTIAYAPSEPDGYTVTDDIGIRYAEGGTNSTVYGVNIKRKGSTLTIKA